LVGTVDTKMKKPIKFFILYLLLTCLIGTYSLSGADDPPAGQEKPQPPVQEDQVQVHRNLFMGKDTPTEQLSISASELLKAGDTLWLRQRLVDPGASQDAIMAILWAFISHKDNSAFSEFLMLSLKEEWPNVQDRCHTAISIFLEDKKNRHTLLINLRALCKSPDTPLDQLCAAMRALGQSRDIKGVEVLIPFLEHEDKAVKKLAIASLRKLTHVENLTTVAEWKAWWEKNKDLDRDYIIESVLLEQIKKHKKDSEESRARNEELAFQIIGKDPKKAVQFLTEDSPKIRRRAAEIINKHCTEDKIKGVIEKVRVYLIPIKDDDATVLPLLALIGADPEKNQANQAVLLTYLNDKNSSDGIRAQAANSLTGYKNEDVLKAVVGILTANKDTKDRALFKVELLNLLAHVGCEPHFDLIKSFLNLKNEKDIRRAAVKALGATGCEAAIDVLGKILKDDDKSLIRFDPEFYIRFEAIDSLALLTKLGAPGSQIWEKAVAMIKLGLDDKALEVRKASISQLGLLNPSDGLQIFQERLRVEKSPEVKDFLISALGEIKNPGGIKVICSALPQVSEKKATGGNGEDHSKLFQTAQSAVESICGDDPKLWLQAIEVFFEGKQYSLVVGWCIAFKNRTNGKNGENGNQKKVESLSAEASYRSDILDNNLQSAEVNIERLVELNPENNAFLKEYADLLLQLKKYPEALAEFKKLLSRLSAEPDAKQWEVRVCIAGCYLDMGTPVDANMILKGFPPAGMQNPPEALAKNIKALLSRAKSMIEKKTQEQTESQAENLKKKTAQEKEHKGDGKAAGDKSSTTTIPPKGSVKKTEEPEKSPPKSSGDKAVKEKTTNKKGAESKVVSQV